MTGFSVQHDTVRERIQVLSRPVMLPGQCAICGFAGTNVSDEGDIRVFMDWQLDIDYYGRVVICSTCLLAASNVLGWIGVKQADELKNKVQEQTSELIVLREQNERLRASLTSLLGGSDPDFRDTVLDINSDERSGEQESQGTDEISEGHKSDLDESFGGERLSGVPANSSRDNSGQLGVFDL